MDGTVRSACELLNQFRNKKLVVAYGVAEKTVEGDSITGTIMELNITPKFLWTEWSMVGLTWSWRYRDLTGESFFKMLCILGFFAPKLT
jgi:hypothetical protein